MLKSLIQSIVHGFATLIVSPMLFTHWLASLATCPDQSLESHSQLLSLFPGVIGNSLRVAFLRRTLEYCHPSATVCFGALFSKTGARIEEHVYIGPNCMIGLATIQKDVLLGPAVQIPSGPRTHGIERTDIPIRNQTGSPTRVTIHQDCWIGGGSIVLNDVQTQTVVAAHSVVTKTFEPQVVLAGIPAKVIASRRENTANT